MCHKCSHLLQMPSEAVHKLFIITTPFPSVQVSILSPCDKGFVLIKHN